MTVTLDLGRLRVEARVFGPGAVVPDAEGGFSRTPVALAPAVWRCAVEKASPRAIERRFAGTVTAQATHILSGRFHAGITTESVVTWTDRAGVAHTASVLDTDDTEGAGVESVVLVSEVVP